MNLGAFEGILSVEVCCWSTFPKPCFVPGHNSSLGDKLSIETERIQEHKQRSYTLKVESELVNNLTIRLSQNKL